jgi:MFS family permease
VLYFDFSFYLEASESEIGFLFASKAIAQIIANPFVGVIADRIGPRL